MLGVADTHRESLGVKILKYVGKSALMIKTYL